MFGKIEANQLVDEESQSREPIQPQPQLEQQWQYSHFSLPPSYVQDQPHTQSYAEVNELICEIDKIIDNVAQITNLPKHSVRMLLEKNKFSQQKVLEKMYLQGNLQIEIDSLQNSLSTQNWGQCRICNQNGELLILKCGHTFCHSCLIQYLKVYYVGIDQKQTFAKCLYQGCQQALNGLYLEHACKDQTIKRHFERILCQKYAHSSQHLVQCSRISCQAYIVPYGPQTVVICRCGNQMCKVCKEENHFPLTCQQNRANSNVFYGLMKIAEKTVYQSSVFKSCLNCKIVIQKNGGCLKMRCRCGHQFCWNCLNDWQGHKSHYSCNRVRASQQSKDVQDFGYQNCQFVKFVEKFAQLQTLGTNINSLQSLNIHGIVLELLNYQISEFTSQKLYTIQNLVVNIYRLYFNYEVLVFYQNLSPFHHMQVVKAKLIADQLYRLVHPQFYLQNCLSDLTSSHRIQYTNDLISVANSLWCELKEEEYF